MSKKKITNKSEIISDKRSYAEIVASLPENYSKPYKSPFAEDARPHIYVYDANKPEGAIVSLTKDKVPYVLQTTQDANLAGKTFVLSAKGKHVLTTNIPAITSDYNTKLFNFGKKMNDTYARMQASKDEAKRKVFDTDNAKQVNSLGDIIVKDVAPTVGNFLKMALGSATPLGRFIPAVKEWTDEGTKGVVEHGKDTGVDTWNMVKEGVIDPVSDGDFLAALSNTLTNLGETMDVITGTAGTKPVLQSKVYGTDPSAADPVKTSLIKSLKAAKNNPENPNAGAEAFDNYYDTIFPKGNPYEWDEEKGRPSYDWDTGNMATDMIAEIVSDPTTWLSFGASGAVKGAAKGAAETIAEKTTKTITKTLTDAGVDVAEEAVQGTMKSVQKSLAKTLRNSATAVDPENIASKLTNAILKTDSIDSAVNKKVLQDVLTKEGVSTVDDLAKAATNTVATQKGALRQTLLDGMYTGIKKDLTQEIVQAQLSHLDNLRGGQKLLDDVQKEAMNVAMLPSSFMPVALSHWIRLPSGQSLSDIIQGVVSSAASGVASKMHIPQMATGTKYIVNKLGNKIKDFITSPQTKQATEEICCTIDDAVKTVMQKWGLDDAENTSKNMQEVIKHENMRKVIEDLRTTLNASKTGSMDTLATLDEAVTAYTNGDVDSLEKFLNSLGDEPFTDASIATKVRELKDYANRAPLLEVKEQLEKILEFQSTHTIDNATIDPDKIAKAYEQAGVPNTLSDMDTLRWALDNEVFADVGGFEGYLDYLEDLSKNPILSNNKKFKEELNYTQNAMRNKNWTQTHTEYDLMKHQTKLIEAIKESLDSIDAKLLDLNTVFSKDKADYLSQYTKTLKGTADSINKSLRKAEKDIEHLTATMPKNEATKLFNSAEDAVKLNDMPYERVYGVKMSNQAKTQAYINDPIVSDLFDRINQEGTLRESIKSTQSDGIYKAKMLTTANAYENFKYCVQTLQDANLPENLKAGVLDAVMAKATTNTIGNAEQFTKELLTHTRRYVDSTAHTHNLHFEKQFNTPDTYSNVTKMLEAVQDEHSSLNKIYTELTDGDDVNVLFSLARTQDGVSEITFHVNESDLAGTHTFRLKDAQDNVSKSFVKEQYDMDMDDYYKSTSKRADVETNKGLQVYDNIELFAANVADFIKEIQQYGKANGAQRNVRLIGANSAAENLGQSEALSKLFASNRAKIWLREEATYAPDAYSLTTRDLLQHLNYKEGAVIIDDATYRVVANMVEELQNRLRNATFEVAVKEIDTDKLIRKDAMNKYQGLSNTQLAPVFDDELYEALEKFCKTFETEATNSLRNPGGISNYYTLRSATNRLYDLEATTHSFEGMLSNLALTEVATKTNVMKIIQDASTKLPYGTLNVVKRFDKSVFSKLDTSIARTPSDWMYSYKVMRDTDKTYRKCTNIPLLNEIARDIDREGMWETLTNRLEVLTAERQVLTNGAMTTALTAKGEVAGRINARLPQNHAPLSDAEDLIMLHDTLTDVLYNMPFDAIPKDTKGIFKTYLKIIEEIGYSDAFSKAINFNPYLDVLTDSYYYKLDSNVGRLVDTVDAIDKGIAKCETLEEQVLYKELVAEVHGFHTSEMQIQVQALRNFKDFYQGMQKELDKLRQKYFDRVNGVNSTYGARVRHDALKEFSMNVNLIQKVKDKLCEDMIIEKINVLKKFTADKYKQYLYKYCKGRQIIYKDSEILLHNDFPKKLKTMIENGQMEGVHCIEKNNKLLIWLDASLAESDEFIEAASKLELPSLRPDKQASEQPTIKFLNSMDAVTGNSYRYSNHTAFDEFHYQEVTDFFEKAGAKNMIDISHFRQRNDFIGSFNHTIIGDYGDGVGEVFSKTSRNPISNFASGFNSAYSFMATKENYATLLFNRQNSIRTLVGKTPLDEATKAIHRHNLIPCKLKNGKVVRINLRGKGHLASLMKDDDVCLLNYLSYTSAVEHLNNNNFSSRVYKFLNRHWLAPIKIGQLSSVGWFIRNMSDSSTKGAFQSGQFFDFYKTFNTTRQIIDKFDRTYGMIYKEYAGKVSKRNIAEFFLTHSEKEGILNESLFKRLSDFFDSSSASPTARQLDLQEDIMSLIKKRTKDLDIADKDKYLKEFYSFYKKNLDLEDKVFVRKFLKENPDAPEEIARLIYTIPQQSKELLITKIPTVRGIMNINNKIETYMRAHVYLYQTVYCSNMSDAAYHLVDLSQFNTTRNSKVRKLFDQVFPFSSFAIDNLLYYIDLLGDDPFFQKLVYQALPVPFENMDAEAIMENGSLQYAILNGNIMLNDGLYLKTNYSLFSAMQLMIDPMGSMSNMLHTSVDSTKTLFSVIQSCWEEGKTPWEYFDAVKDLQQEYYDNGGWLDDDAKRAKIYSQVDEPEALQALLNLIPMLGVTWQRWTSPTGKSELGDSILQYLFPGLFSEAQSYADKQGWLKDPLTAALASTPVISNMFGAVKPTNKPIGYDWYNQSMEYRRTHQYVAGVSYVPSFLYKDPTKYVDTYGHLLKAGYSEKTAWQMMREGWKYDIDASTFYNTIASWDYYIIRNGYRYGISEDLVDVYKQGGFTVYKNEEKIPYWLASKKGNAYYQRTYKYFEAQGYKPAEIIGKMAEGWYIAVTGDLVNRAELNERDEQAYKQLKLWQEGKAPFPADYVTKEERINPQGDGDTFAEAWYKRNGFRYMENMWLDPDTGETYFKETKESKEYFARLYDRTYNQAGHYNSGYRRRYTPRAPYIRRPRQFYVPRYPNSQLYSNPQSPRVYYKKFNINKYSAKKYKNGTVTTPVAKSYKVTFLRNIRTQTYPNRLQRKNIVTSLKLKRAKPNYALTRLKINRYRHSARQYRFNQLRFWSRY